MRKNIKKIVCVLLLVATLFTMVACSPKNMNYVLVANIPVSATSNTIGTKTGEYEEYYLGVLQVNEDGKFIVDGKNVGGINYFIEKTDVTGATAVAAKNGGITKMSTVDMQIWASPTYWKVVTVVTGE